MTTIAKPAPLEPAIEELQTRAWQLRSLIQCVQQATDDNRRVEDLYAVLSSMLELADSIHQALDFQALTERAEEIAKGSPPHD